MLIKLQGCPILLKKVAVGGDICNYLVLLDVRHSQQIKKYLGHTIFSVKANYKMMIVPWYSYLILLTKDQMKAQIKPAHPKLLKYYLTIFDFLPVMYMQNHDLLYVLCEKFNFVFEGL